MSPWNLGGIDRSAVSPEGAVSHGGIGSTGSFLYRSVEWIFLLRGTMFRLPLERFELFRSSDLDFTREAVGRIFTPHRLDLIGKNANLNARMHSRRLRDVSVSYIAYGGEVRVEPGELETFYVVQVPLSGSSRVRCGTQQVYSTPDVATVVSPTEPLSQRLSADCAWLICRIERAALEAHLRDMLGEPLPEPLRFDLGMNVTDGYGQSWRSALTILVNELDRPGSLINALPAACKYEEGLMTALLVAQRHNYTDFFERRQPAAPSRAVGLAQELMESHPEWEHTISGLAREAGVSVRALQKGFRDQLETTPSTYLREVRLRRAHAELLAARPDRATVGSIAARWGFMHAGRFAALYRRHFGEPPLDTLRR